MLLVGVEAVAVGAEPGGGLSVVVPALVLLAAGADVAVGLALVGWAGFVPVPPLWVAGELVVVSELVEPEEPEADEAESDEPEPDEPELGEPEPGDPEGEVEPDPDPLEFGPEPPESAPELPDAGPPEPEALDPELPEGEVPGLGLAEPGPEPPP